MTDAVVRDEGSYRDPAGHVFKSNGRIFRTVGRSAVSDYEWLRGRGLLERLAQDGWLVATHEVDLDLPEAWQLTADYVLEHARIDYISFPYEWPFPALKAAALHHLDLHLELLGHGATLSDASAYNIQFEGARPVFIDVLSLRPYREDEYWLAHRQFCEQFLNPLLLRAMFGIPHNAWYRGSLEGIETDALARLMPLRRKLSWNVLSHVVLQARLNRTASANATASIERVRARRLSKTGYVGLLRQLRRWIASLTPRDTGPTTWGDYERLHTYSWEEEADKRQFVAEFVGRVQPGLLFDLGCNAGAYAALALASGARRVIGFDYDQRALEIAFARARADKLDFLPLFLDAGNPSPDQGWRQAERPGFERRARADALLGLAFTHHLAIGRNIPLDRLLEWITNLAPQGVVEFVPKDDPTVRQMLALRDDVFPTYHQEAFEAGLQRCARIVRSAPVSRHNRRLYWYDRSA